MDARKTIEKLKGEADRTRMSLYLSQSIFNEFKSSCGDVAPSRVIEELMKEFIESSRNGRPIQKRQSKKIK
jgi:hypothetical protein